MKPRKVAAYVRISDDRVKDSAGVGRQEQDARDQEGVAAVVKR